MWRLLYKEYKPDTATRKVGLLERAMEISLLLEWISVIGFSGGWFSSVNVNKHVVA